MEKLPTLYEFNALSIDDRADLVWTHGTLLTSCDNDGGKSVFYSFSDFYVEIVVSGDPQRITLVTPFYTGPKMDQMLSAIDLNKL